MKRCSCCHGDPKIRTNSIRYIYCSCPHSELAEKPTLFVFFLDRDADDSIVATESDEMESLYEPQSVPTNPKYSKIALLGLSEPANENFNSIPLLNVETNYPRLVLHRLPVEAEPRAGSVGLTDALASANEHESEIEVTKRGLLEKTRELKLKLESLKIAQKN